MPDRIPAQPEPVEAQPETPSGNVVEAMALDAFEMPASFTENRVLLTVITGSDNDLWWVASEVCRILGYANPQDAVKDNVRKRHQATSAFCEVSPDGADRHRNEVIVNEGGLKALIRWSRAPQAGKFYAWVTNKVIPKVKRPGHYDPEFGSKIGLDIENMRTLLNSLGLAIDLLQEKDQALAEAQPKVDYYDTYVTSKGLLTLTDAAKHLGITPNLFFAQLHQDKVLSHTGTMRNKAFQRYIDDGYFVRTAPPDAKARTWPQTMVTAKGLLFLTARYGRPDKAPTKSHTPSA